MGGSLISGASPRPRWPAALLGLAVPGLLAAFTQIPLETDSAVHSVDFPESHERLLVFFGYTDCPTVCPTSMVRLLQIYKALDGDPLRRGLGVAFVNLTEERPEVVDLWAKAFHPDFEGVQAGPRARAGLMRDFGVRFERDDDSPAAWHTDSVYVLVRGESGWRLRAVIPQVDLREKTIRGILEDLAERNLSS